MKDISKNSVALKPLATSRQNKPQLHIASWRKPHSGIRYVSNLRVNRALLRKPETETLVRPTPSSIRGERLFEPSQDLQKRIKRLQEAEAALTGTKIAPFPPTRPETIEERKKELEEARVSYETQIEKLKRKEEALQETVAQTAEKIAETQQELTRQTEETERERQLREQLEAQRAHISDYERRHKSLQQQLSSVQNTWKEKISHLEQLKTEAQLQSERSKAELGKVRTSYQEQINRLQQREQDLQQTVEQTALSLVSLQQEIAEQKGKTDTQRAYSEKLSSQQAHIRELEANYQNLQEKLTQNQEDLKTKITQLQQLKAQTETGTVQEMKRLGQQVHGYQEKINLLRKKKNEMVQHIHKEEAELEKLQNAVSVLSSENKEKEQLIEQQQRQLEDLQKDKEKISRFANELVKKLSQVEDLQRVESTITIAKKKKKKSDYKAKIIKAVPQAKDIPPLTDKPNAISGIVRNVEGEPIEGTLVVIKNSEQQPQRALRTSKIGEFLVSSPLPNGIYRIETQKEGYCFDIIELELSGKVLKPVEVTAIPT